MNNHDELAALPAADAAGGSRRTSAAAEEGTKIERVARAMYENKRASLNPILARSGHDLFVSWEDASEETKRGWRDDARPAIEAMREPTDKMLDAGAKHMDWIVVSGALLDGPSFVFLGPYTKADAELVRDYMRDSNKGENGYRCIATELLSPDMPDRIRRNRKGD